MSTAEKRDTISEAEYLAMCEQSNERLELIDGEVYAMTGATGRHNTLVMNISGILWNFLKGKKCRPFASDMKVKVSEDTIFYPDAMVDCDYKESNPLFAGKPVIVIEVLSPSTESYNRGAKFNQYKQLASLEEYVLIEQKEMNVSVYRRSNSWNATNFTKGDDIELQSIGLTIPIEEIYYRIFS